MNRGKANYLLRAHSQFLEFSLDLFESKIDQHNP